MTCLKIKAGKKGAALLVVLFIVMVITITSIGFLSRSDVELACGQNMALRIQMDYLAESGLEHAKGLILNPQDIDISTGHWTASDQQLVAGNDYYDVEVIRDSNDRCNYIIDCNSYRLRNSEKIGRSNIKAELRLDPCIAYWAGSSTTVSPQITINGDVYCNNGDLTNNGIIDGDVFAYGTVTGANIAGRKNELVSQAPVVWPGLMSSNFGPTYYIGSTSYSAEIVDANVPLVGSFIPSAENPAGICYCSGSVEIVNGVNINGTLVVNGTLKISGVNNVITAVKNFPALLVNGEVVVGDGGTLVIEGLAQIGQRIAIDEGAENVDIDVIGGLFIGNGGIDGISSGSVSIDITSAPATASLQTWPAFNTAKRWGQAAGAFFKSIQRQ